MSYKPLHLEAQQRLQEEGCVVDISEQGSIYWRPESRSPGTVHVPVAEIYEYYSVNYTRFPQQNPCVNIIADGYPIQNRF